MNIEETIPKLPFTENGYEFQEFIGKGGFSCVVRVVQLSTKHIFAAKIIPCSNKKVDNCKPVTPEIKCLTKLLHPNIIKIYDHFQKGDLLFLILEYCTNGSLQNSIMRGIPLSEQQTLFYMKELLHAVDYCHSRGIAHRDIKPGNIFISENDVLKLGDFGLGIEADDNEMIKSCCGSFAYKAPELLRNQEHSPFKSDIWSLGVTFFNIATGSLPFGYTKECIIQNVLTGSYHFPIGTPQSVISIIEQMLVSDPNERPTAKELLKSPCFCSFVAYQKKNIFHQLKKNTPYSNSYNGRRRVFAISAAALMKMEKKKL